MKEIYNIFSNQKEKKEVSKNIIIIDTRETKSDVVEILYSKDVKIEFEKLEIGDYLIGDVLIERKTFSDFISSILNKRLIEQLSNLKNYEKKFLLIEGFDYNYERVSIHGNAIRGMLLSIATEFKIPMIFTKDAHDTCNFLILQLKKIGKIKIHSKRVSRKNLSIEEQKEYILEGFPGIGGTLAKRLLKRHHTLKKVFSLTKKDLEKIDKFNDFKIGKFLKILRS